MRTGFLTPLHLTIFFNNVNLCDNFCPITEKLSIAATGIPFGTVTYINIPKHLREKLDPKAKKGIFISYAFKTKGFRIWLLDEHKVTETINVSSKVSNPTPTSSSGARPT